MLHTELKLVEAEVTIKQLENNLKLEEEESFWKGLHRKHIGEDLKDLKVYFCYLFHLFWFYCKNITLYQVNYQPDNPRFETECDRL